MDYWLLLALVYTVGAAAFVVQPAAKERSLPKWVLAIGFFLLAAGLLLQIVLHYEFQAWAVRGFYWLRSMLALAWLGTATALLTWPQHRYARWLTWGLLAASLAALGLVAFTQITEAQGWFDPAAPIYGQLGDLLATNRPTRWGGLALNLYGFAALVGAAGYRVYAQRKYTWQMALRAVAIVASAAWLLGSLTRPATEATLAFYLGEFGAPLLLVWGASGLFPLREALK